MREGRIHWYSTRTSRILPHLHVHPLLRPRQRSPTEYTHFEWKCSRFGSGMCGIRSGDQGPWWNRSFLRWNRPRWTYCFQRTRFITCVADESQDTCLRHNNRKQQILRQRSRKGSEDGFDGGGTDCVGSKGSCDYHHRGTQGAGVAEVYRGRGKSYVDSFCVAITPASDDCGR